MLPVIFARVRIPWEAFYKVFPHLNFLGCIFFMCFLLFFVCCLFVFCFDFLCVFCNVFFGCVVFCFFLLLISFYL